MHLSVLVHLVTASTKNGTLGGTKKHGEEEVNMKRKFIEETGSPCILSAGSDC